jgi:hypothetical protein
MFNKTCWCEGLQHKSTWAYVTGRAPRCRGSKRPLAHPADEYQFVIARKGGRTLCAPGLAEPQPLNSQRLSKLLWPARTDADREESLRRCATRPDCALGLSWGSELRSAGGAPELPPEPDRENVPYPADPLRRLVAMHSSAFELMTSSAFVSPWPRDDAGFR